jgi:hypothetical protein
VTDGLLAQARQQFDRAAASAGGETVRRFAVGGHHFDVRFAGEALVPSTTRALDHLALGHFALGHLALGAPPPALTIYAWDTASTGVPFPIDRPEDRLRIPAWRRWGPREEVGIQGLRVMHQPHEDLVDMLGDGIAVHWVADPGRLPYYEHSAPMLHLLHWWLAGLGLYMLHAGAVGGRDGGALLVGPGGSGKSTSALACLGTDLGYVGDDYTLVGLVPEPQAVNLYSSAKLERSHVPRLAHVLPPMANPEPEPDDKALYFLTRGIAADVPLRALVSPRVVERPTPRLIPLDSGASILAALAPTSILQLPGAGATALRVMRELCQRVPAFALELGADVDAIPNVLAELLSP